MFRIVLIPPLLWTLWSTGGKESATLSERLLVTGLIAVIGLSDLLDGWLARRWGLASTRGAALDAAADRTAELGILVLLTISSGGAFARLPPWLLGAVVGRDLVLVPGWLVLRRKGHPEVAEHRWHGKLATGLLFGLFLWVVLGLPSTVVAPWALAITAVLVVSVADYVRRGLARIGPSEPPGG